MVVKLVVEMPAVAASCDVCCRPAYCLVTTDVIEAACACLVATLEESSEMNEAEAISERLVLEEFGRCLTRVIDSANNLTGLKCQRAFSYFYCSRATFLT